MTNTMHLKTPTTVDLVLYRWERGHLANGRTHPPTHDWAIENRAIPVRINCVIAPYGRGRVKVDLVKIMDPVPDWINSRDRLSIARLARERLGDMLGCEVVTITADDVMPFAADDY